MKYVATFLSTAVLAILLICSFNWLVDPFGMYWSPTLSGFNQHKPAAGNRVRVSKAYRVPVVTPEVLLVGNSRVEMGLSPLHPIFEGRSVYNLGMPGASVGMQVDYSLNAILATDTIKTVLVGVDFLDFLVRNEVTRFAEGQDQPPAYMSRLVALSPSSASGLIFRFKEKLAMIFSLDSFYASVGTVLSQNALLSTISPQGMNTATGYISIIRSEGVNALFVQKIQELERNLTGKDLVVYSNAAARPSPGFAHLQRLLDEARARNIKVHVFINPYHYSYVHLLEDVGLVDEFWQWKSLLVQQLSETPNQNFTLWDFSGFSPPVLEPVPVDTPKREMSWYWEPAHYRKELGDRMLGTMLSGGQGSFGVRLHPGNIEAVLSQNQQDLAATKDRWVDLKHSLGLSE